MYIEMFKKLQIVILRHKTKWIKQHTYFWENDENVYLDTDGGSFVLLC